MKALVFKGTVVDMHAAEFPVHKDMSWHDAPDGCERGWLVDEDGALVAPPPPEPLSWDVLRAGNYPPLGDAADIAYKQRQKARMLVAQARQKIVEGDKDAALLILIEAVEPVEDAKDYDGQVSAVKKKYPKPEEE